MMRKEVRCTVEPGTHPRTLKFTLSNRDVDREGDTIDPAGWQLDEYRANPVVLFGHRHDIPAIARTIDIGVVGGALKATAEFPPPGIHPLADTVFGLAKSGFPPDKSSVGFVPVTAVPNQTGGYDYTSQILHEWSVVNVPALPAAQLEASASVAAAVQKWLGHAALERDDEMLTLDPAALGRADEMLSLDLTPRGGADELVTLDLDGLARSSGMVSVDLASLPRLVGAAVGAQVRQEVRRQLNQLAGRVD